MLVLSRRPGEFVTVTVPPSKEAQTIGVCLVNSSGCRARLGFLAAKSVSIGRDNMVDGGAELPPPVAEAKAAV